jgi:Ankyrin repeats (3 copies)/Ankyrin repeat
MVDGLRCIKPGKWSFGYCYIFKRNLPCQYGIKNLQWIKSAALRQGFLEIIQYLLCHVDNEAIDKKVYTALHCASYNGYLDLVRFLVESDYLYAEAKNRYGLTALHCASRKDHLVVVQYLIEAQHVSADTRCKNGWTALHFACHEGFLHTVRYLIEEGGVNTEIKTTLGLTANDLGRKHDSVKEYLEERRSTYR